MNEQERFDKAEAAFQSTETITTTIPSQGDRRFITVEEVERELRLAGIQTSRSTEDNEKWLLFEERDSKFAALFDCETPRWISLRSLWGVTNDRTHGEMVARCNRFNYRSRFIRVIWDVEAHALIVVVEIASDGSAEAAVATIRKWAQELSNTAQRVLEG